MLFVRRLRSLSVERLPGVGCLGLTAALAMAAPALGSPSQVTAPDRVEVLEPHVCFAPGTPRENIENYYRRSFWQGLETSLQVPGGSRDSFSDGNRWSTTATNGSGLSQGDPTTLTWSIVPDGTSIHNYSSSSSEVVAPSNLRARLNEIYGSQAVWLPIFEGMFERWGDLIGVTYVYESSDDGAAFSQGSLPSGQLGVRGDIRIAGHHIDGNSGILAYNFYPNTGDMVIDTNDTFYDNTGSSSLGLRNVLAHEHGHGLGLPHVCPVNQTKLMEPFVSFAFDGPQHDDIRAMNRGYGDAREHNDSVSNPEALGSVTSTTIPTASIDDNSDVDWFSLTLDAGASVSVTVTPIGSNYLSGPQNQNGSCTAGSSFDTLNIQDLSVAVIDKNGVTVVDNSDSGGLGQSESLADVLLTSGAGTYYVKVDGGNVNDAQLYELEIAVASTDNLFTDGFESGNTSGWSTQGP